MSHFSQLQRDGIQKLISGLQGLLESQVFNIYGFDPETEIDILRNQVSNLSDLPVRIQALEKVIDDLTNESTKLKKQMHGLENVIMPDETDVHNINRRIELLAKRIAELESKKGWFNK